MHSAEAKIYIIVIAAIVASGSVIAYYIYSIVQNHKLEIERKKKYMFNEMNVLERERERIAHNIHDGAGPELSMLKFDLDDIEVADEKSLEVIESLKTKIDSIISDFRLLSHNLMPNSLIKFGLVSAITEICNKMSKSDLTIQFESSFDKEIPLTTSIHLFRIVEEIIYNTIKHADASCLKILLFHKKNSIHIVARDDGKGFVTKDGSKSDMGLGLKGFEYRTELLGGNFTIYSEKDKGVEIKINIPIKTII